MQPPTRRLISRSAKTPPPASSPSQTSERGIESQVICLPFRSGCLVLWVCPLGTADSPSPLCRVIKLRISPPHSDESAGDSQMSWRHWLCQMNKL